MAAKLLPPIHPGEILRDEFMVPMQLPSHAVARAIGVTPTRANDIVNEKRGITADTALRLGPRRPRCGSTCRSGSSWKRRAASWAMRWFTSTRVRHDDHALAGMSTNLVSDDHGRGKRRS